MDIKNKKLLYHLTHYSNLENIINNGLLSRNLCKSLLKVDVADYNILSKRKENRLDDYIPFHFYPNTSFDVAVRSKYNPEDFVYITVSRKFAEENNFKIIPSHPLSGTYEIFDYQEGFSKIDWEMMEELMDNIEENKKKYAKMVKMAECISEKSISVNDFAYIYCSSNIIENLKKIFPDIAEKFRKGVWFNDN